MSDVPRETIDKKVERIETIIRALQEDDVSLGRAKELRDEGEELLRSLEGDLDIGDAEILEQ